MNQRIVNKKFYYLYKITNTINGKFYYGIHSTNDIDDNYMGSGKALNFAYKKYGIENFKKEIIQYCNTFEELSELEKNIVNINLLSDASCYNLIEGGYYISEETLQKIGKINAEKQKGEKNSQYGKIWVTDGINSKMICSDELEFYINNGWKKGRHINITDKFIKANRNRCWVYKNGKSYHINKDQLNEYLNNGYIIGRCEPKPKPKRLEPFEGSMKGKVYVRDKNNNCFTISVNDPRYISGELVPYNKGKVSAIDSLGNKIFIDKEDERLKSGEYSQNFYQIGALKNKVVAKDKENNILVVNSDDDRLKTGELVGVNKNKHWKQKRKNK